MGAKYEFFCKCKVCNGETRNFKSDLDYWEPFMTPEEIKRNPSMQEIFRMNTERRKQER